MGLYRALWPVLSCLEPETAHRLALGALKRGLVPAPPTAGPGADPPALGQGLWGLRFANPIGLAAGFDKDAEVPGRVLAQGFGFVEIGTVTPAPQPGNPKPRLFRLADDGAVINRLGFNSKGAEVVLGNLRRAREGGAGPIGVNIGANAGSEDPAADYAAGARAFAADADYLVVNVSSPNTPGLRALQGPEALSGVLAQVMAARDEAAPADAPPVLLKVAPDLTEDELAAIAETALDAGIEGLVATNTTTERPPGLSGRHAHEPGGLSGQPLLKRSTRVLAELYRLTEGRLALVGVGGVASGEDAYAKIRAGASLVQLYTALVFEGPGLVRCIKLELAGLLAEDGFATVAEAVGADHA